MAWSSRGAIGVLGFALSLFGRRAFDWLPFRAAPLALPVMHGPRAETV